jgi:8-oxo-dGTP pyrophosphatase MutT (NUDIX family)
LRYVAIIGKRIKQPDRKSVRPWKKLTSIPIISDRWLRLRADCCELSNGITISPYYVIEDYDWVHIIAFSNSGDILTVSQYRYAGNKAFVELPAGICEPGEDPESAARRELQEETGIKANSWTHLASLWANPARQTNRVHIFLANDLRNTGKQSLDESEEISWEFKSVEEIKGLIQNGKFGQSMHIASFYLGIERIRTIR